MAAVWLPNVVSHLEQHRHPARTRPLADPAERPDLDYIVVDEIEEDVAILLIEPWPGLDQRGRLRFGDEEQRASVEVDVAALLARLSDRQEMIGLSSQDHAAFAGRAVRVGDTFAGRVDREALATETEALGFLVGPLVDITREAREAAKAQRYATAAPVLSEDDVARLLAPEDAEGPAAPA
jgi:hypothetical protein